MLRGSSRPERLITDPSVTVRRLLAWFLPLREAVEKGVETEQESALVISVLGEA